MRQDRYTRAAMLQRAGMLGGAVALAPVLSACGDSGGTSATSSAPTSTLSAADVEQRLANATGSLRTLLWPIYGDGPKAALEGRVDVRIAPMAAIEDPINKRGTYDIGVNVSGLFPQMHEAGLLHELDTRMIPNLSGLMENSNLFADGTARFASIDGKVYGVPYLWSSFGVSYLPGEVATPPASLQDLAGPEFAGKLGIGDDATSAILMVARELELGSGSPGNLTTDELEEAFALLEELKARARTIVANPYGEYAGAYSRGEIVAAFPDWVGTTLAASAADVEAEISYGPFSYSYIDTLFLSADAEATDAVYAFLNEALDPQWNVELGGTYGPGSVVAEAEEQLVEQPGVPQAFGDIQALTDSAPMIEWPPLESDDFVSYGDWLSRWQRFKAA